MNDNEIAALLAAYPAQKLADGAYLTPPCRLSWISLATPSASMSRAEDLRYRATLLFPLACNLDILKAAAQEAAAAKWGAKLGEVAANPMFKRPLMLQDNKAGKYDGYVAGAMRANVATKRKPVIVGLDRVALDAADQMVVYPGMWARAKITVRAYDEKGGRGVAFDLVSLQKLADDNAFGGASVDATAGFETGSGFTPKPATPAATPAPVSQQPAGSLF